MSEGERREVSFAFDTSDDFRRKWRALDISTDVADALLEVAKERRDDDSVNRRSMELTELQHEMSDVVSAEVRKGLEAHKRELVDYHTWGVSFAGRVMHLTVFEPLEAWQER